MNEFDVVIVGAGLAGSLSSAILHRAGMPAIAVDPHPNIPTSSAARRSITGSSNADPQRARRPHLDRRGHRCADLWIARLGHIVQKRVNDQYGIAYATWSRRSARTRRSVWGKVADVSLSGDRQQVTLADGRTCRPAWSSWPTASTPRFASTRIEPRRAQPLPFDQPRLRHCAAGREAFDFHAFTYYSEKTGRPDRLRDAVSDARHHAREHFTYRR